eukprot:1120425-Pleurochrysis_carterae.AAC.2
MYAGCERSNAYLSQMYAFAYFDETRARKDICDASAWCTPHTTFIASFTSWPVRPGFSADELKELSLQIDVNAEPAEPGYYPLPQATVGERFPRADDGRTAVLSPVPPRRADFLHSILHAIGAVEAEGYAALKELGASPLKRVLTCGGGASNDAWMQMRQRMLGVPTARAEWTDAAVGVALLAARGTDN